MSPAKLYKTPFWARPAADTPQSLQDLPSSPPTHLFGFAKDLLHEDEVVASVSAHQLLQAPTIQAQPGCGGDRAAVTHSPIRESHRKDEQLEEVRVKEFAAFIRSQQRKKPPTLVLDRSNLTSGAYLSSIAPYPSSSILLLTQSEVFSEGGCLLAK